jgi:hypothetical protein
LLYSVSAAWTLSTVLATTVAVSTAIAVSTVAVATFTTGAIFTGWALTTLLAGWPFTALFALLATWTAALAAGTVFAGFAAFGALYGAGLLTFATLCTLFAGWALAAGSALAATFTAATFSAGLAGSALFTRTLFALNVTFRLLKQYFARQAKFALVVNAEQLNLYAVTFFVKVAWVFNALPVHL